MARHVCPATGCKVWVPAHRLMCPQHWYMVPEGLRRTIWRLWADGKPRAGHREACQSATEQVNSQLQSRKGTLV